MPDVIATDALIATILVNKVKAPLTDYVGFSMESVASSLPVSSGSTHDGLSSEVGRTISLWKQLIESDSAALLSTHDALQSVDADIANGMQIPSATAFSNSLQEKLRKSSAWWEK